MGYTVYYTKTWLLPFGKQTPWPPGLDDNPIDSGGYPANEVSYEEPISFMGRIMLSPVGYLHFQFYVHTHDFGEADYVRIQTTKNVVLMKYFVTFECEVGESSHWEYYYTFDLLDFPGVQINTAPWTGNSGGHGKPYPGAASAVTYAAGVQDPTGIYAGFRFRFPYVTPPAILPVSSIGTPELRPWERKF